VLCAGARLTIADVSNLVAAAAGLIVTNAMMRSRTPGS
jgi:hypothetical protein